MTTPVWILHKQSRYMVLLRCCVALYGGVSRVCVFVIPSVMSCCRALAHGVLCHWFSAMFGACSIR